MEMTHDPAFAALLADGPMPSGWALDAAEWDDLARDCADANCFYAPELLIPAGRHLAGNDAISLIAARDDAGRLIGLIPIAMAGRHGRLPVANAVNWVHRHCFYGAPLLRRGHEQAAWSAILRQLDQMKGPAFLHLSGLDAAGRAAAALEATCVAEGRTLSEIQRHARALLRSDMSADAYWEANVRAKKRKELRRLHKRLAELGELKPRLLEDAGEIGQWTADFLALERAGWKGANGTALDCAADESAFLREALACAMAAGTLSFLRLDLDGRAIAMLINFAAMDGGFSFKIAFDESLARFSPGVLIEIENLRLVQHSETMAWMDSCAAPDHPMIDSLWAERRSIAQYRVELKGGWRRRAALAAAEGAERLSAYLKRDRSE